jgi:hypothetical protein
MVMGTSIMSCDWNVEDVKAKYSSDPAKFRDLIRDVKQKG